MKELEQIEKLRKNYIYCVYEDSRVLAVTEDIQKISTIVREHYCDAEVSFSKLEYQKHDMVWLLSLNIMDNTEEAYEYEFTVSTILKY